MTDPDRLNDLATRHFADLLDAHVRAIASREAREVAQREALDPRHPLGVRLREEAERMAVRQLRPTTAPVRGVQRGLFSDGGGS